MFLLLCFTASLVIQVLFLSGIISLMFSLSLCLWMIRYGSLTAGKSKGTEHGFYTTIPIV